jgi:hypothetical protein
MVITPNELRNYFLPVDILSYQNKGPTKFAETLRGSGFITAEGYLLPNYPPTMSQGEQAKGEGEKLPIGARRRAMSQGEQAKSEGEKLSIDVRRRATSQRGQAKKPSIDQRREDKRIDIWNYRLTTFFQDWGTRDCEHIELHDISNKIIPLKKASSKEEMYEDHLRKNIPNQQLLHKFVLAANQAIFGVSYSLFPSPMKHFLDSLASVINFTVKINRDSIIWVNNIYTIKLLCLDSPDTTGLMSSSKDKNQPVITETLILEDYGPSNFKILQIVVHDLVVQQYLNREYGIPLPPPKPQNKGCYIQ